MADPNGPNPRQGDQKNQRPDSREFLEVQFRPAMAIDDEHRYCRLMKSLDQRLSPNRRHVLNQKPCYEPQQQLN